MGYKIVTSVSKRPSRGGSEGSQEFIQRGAIESSSTRRDSGHVTILGGEMGIEDFESSVAQTILFVLSKQSFADLLLFYPQSLTESLALQVRQC